MKNYESINEPQDKLSSDEIPKMVKWLYALVMFGAAALIFILFENIVPLNIYLVYISLGVILGLGVILILHLILKKKPIR